jgi:hypothetical protein
MMKRVELVLVTVVAMIASCSATFVALHFSNWNRRGNNIETHALTIIDSANQPVAILSSTDNSPQFTLLDRQHRKRASLFLESNGTPDLYLYDASGKERIALDLYDSGVPNLALLGVSGGSEGPNIVLESTSEGQFRLAFHDFGNRRIAGKLDFRMIDGLPSLEMIDGSGKSIWRAVGSHRIDPALH